MTLTLFVFLAFVFQAKECTSFTSSSSSSYPGGGSSSSSSSSSATGRTIISSDHSSDSSSSHPVLPGAVMHLFPRYGYLSLSMRVVPRNDTQNWIFLEPSKEVFAPSSIRLQHQSFAATDNSLPLHNEFHIDLCEDVQQLVQAYFRRFNIEALEKPWHAFAGKLNAHLYVLSLLSYVFVKVFQTLLSLFLQHFQSQLDRQAEINAYLLRTRVSNRILLMID